MAAALLLAACATVATRHQPVEYYGGFNGYSFPLRLKHLKTRAEAEASGAAYYVARYDGHGRLVEVQKVLPGGPDFRHEYVYAADGTLMRVTITEPSRAARLYDAGRTGS